MVSYYHFERDKARSTFEGEFSTFIRHPKYGLEAWCKHYQSWKDKATICLRYEELKEDDVAEFTRMLDAVGLDVQRDVVQQAVQRSRFEKVREVEKKHNVRSSGDYFKEGKRFTRKGRTGEWEDYFDNQDLKYYRQIMDAYSIQKYREHE